MKCIHCESSNGLIIDGTHNLCKAKASLGMKIAKRVDCPACGGSGQDAIKLDAKYAAISGQFDVPSTVYNAINRTCVCLKCSGKG